MAKKQSKDTVQATVTLQNGKWVTSDGLCYNTADKALKHVEEQAVKQESETKTK